MNIKLLDSIKIEQMTNYKDNPVKNQFIIRINGCIIFQSYDSKIAAVDYDKNEIILFPDIHGEAHLEVEAIDLVRGILCGNRIIILPAGIIRLVSKHKRRIDTVEQIHF